MTGKNCSNSDYESSEAPSLSPNVTAVFDELSNTDTGSENYFHPLWKPLNLFLHQ